MIAAPSTAAPAPATPRGAPIGLGHVGVALGEPVALASLAAAVPPEQRPVLEELERAGLPRVRVASEPLADLAARAARDTLAAAGAAAGEVDLVLFASGGLPVGRALTAELWKLARALGLERVPVVAVSGAECGNLGIAVEMAVAAVEAGRATLVLLVTADCCARPADRLCVPPVSVLGDGAASCLVGALSAAPARITGCRTRADASMGPAADAGEIERYVVSLCALLRGAAASAATRAADDRRPAPDVVFTNNLAPAILGTIARILGVPATAIHDASRSSNAHLHAADPLVNLRDYLGGAEAGVARRGAIVAFSSTRCTVVDLALGAPTAPIHGNGGRGVEHRT